ncbi:hypothetical protein [Brevundimonas sp.]|uniref:hypothetical protein n=1 Tax=Brevundimonas sp. TaxID=1871086 RepID=UPI0019A81898|nr:hypothetical protein [Brevundimonas sp.]MBD3837746.1 hypothetical protein [Brevundimonas sp.]
MIPPPEDRPDDWSDLTQAWAATPDDGPPLDAALIRSLRRRDRLARLNFLSEIVGALAVVGVMGWALWRGVDLPVVLAALGFAVFALVMTLWSRRGDPGLLTDTPQAVLRSALGQARTGYRWALAGVAISLAGMVFLIVMLWLAKPVAEMRGPMLAGAGLFLAACIGFYLRHARRCRRRMAAHRAALDALLEREGATHVRS